MDGLRGTVSSLRNLLHEALQHDVVGERVHAGHNARADIEPASVLQDFSLLNLRPVFDDKDDPAQRRAVMLQHALRQLASLSEDKEIRSLLIEMHVQDDLLAVVSKNVQEDEGVCFAALNILVNLSMCKDSRHSLYQTNGLPEVLLKILRSSPPASRLLTASVTLVRNLSDQGGGDNRVQMFKSGIVNEVISIIKREGSNREGEVVNAALSALSNVASHNPSRPKLLREKGFVDTLMDVIRNSEPNSRPLRTALVTLTNLSCHKENRLLMIEMGIADLLITVTLTAMPNSKHLEAALVMLVNMSVMQECRKALVSGGTGEAAIAVIRACMGYESSAGAGGSATKNMEIALKLVQNLSADEETGETLIEHGALDIALLCASSTDPKICAVAAGILSNLALYAGKEDSGVMVALRTDVVAGVLASLIDQPGRAGLSASKAAAYLYGQHQDSDQVQDHPLIVSCRAALDRLCEALRHTLEGKELFGVIFDVDELVLAVYYICRNRMNQETFLAAGGWPLLCRVMQREETTRRTAFFTLRTLHRLALHPALAQELQANSWVRVLQERGDDKTKENETDTIIAELQQAKFFL
mmetsp:Transcript_27696/g.90207  ORF Transcript_27696/g.90207 Transcript_27696/m.90207 type:complete len:587 (-) Transcript_27696:91-1851(-)